MKRFLIVCGVVISLAACDKPSEGDCKRAISNIRQLLGTDKMSTDGGATAGWVRSCRGSAKRASVKCAMEASTVDQLKRCGLLKGQELDAIAPAAAPGPGTAAGTAAGTASGTGTSTP